MMLILKILALLLACQTQIASSKQAQSEPQQANRTLVTPNNTALEQAAVLESSVQFASSATSHKIVGSGWPRTSPMWPTIHTEPQSTAQVPTDQQDDTVEVEPFIYADKPRWFDYSLLLNLNKTLVNQITGQLKPPIVADLSFEYYFNYDSKVTAVPGIKIEVNRKEFKYLDPNQSQIKTRMWIKFNEQIPLTDPIQVENNDWLKFSLVNRQYPSLVAIRRLKVEFATAHQQQSSAIPQQPPVEPSPTDTSATLPQQPQQPQPQDTPNQQTDPQQYPTPQQPLPPPPGQQPQVVENELPPGVVEDTANQRYPPVAGELPPQEETSPVTQQQQQASTKQRPHKKANKDPNIQQAPADEAQLQDSQRQPVPPQANIPGASYPQEPISAASDPLTSTIKPVQPKRKSWSSMLGKRRKRQVSSNGETTARNTSDQTATSISLTCFQNDACDHWQANGTDPIQWSLARMPPSTDSVQNGYFYVSNRINYGDASKMLRLQLNETEMATNFDQNSDHCLELALYVTETTQLKMYRMSQQQSNLQNQEPTKDLNSYNDNDQWIKGPLLVVWSPTVQTRKVDSNSTLAGPNLRISLPGSQLPAMNSSGWTFETLCFSDFFLNFKECGSGKCAFGFEMDTTVAGGGKSYHSNSQLLNDEQPNSNQADGPTALALIGNKMMEQVVGVALLKEFAINKNPKSRSKWLQSWQREDIKPTDDWTFFPELDVIVGSASRGWHSIFLINLFNTARYYLQTKWLTLDEYLDFNAILTIEQQLIDAHSSTAESLAINSTNTAAPASKFTVDNSVSNEADATKSDDKMFYLITTKRLVDSHYETIFSMSHSDIDWPPSNYDISSANTSTTRLEYNLGISNLSDQIKETRQGKLFNADEPSSQMFKLIIELELHVNNNLQTEQSQLSNTSTIFKLAVGNVSLADRCYPNPCQFGSCQQNGTGYDDWQCDCDSSHRGRRCEFGRWCSLNHVTPPPSVVTNTNQQQPRSAPIKQSLPTTRISGKEFCRQKLGQGSRCTELDVPLSDQMDIRDEHLTFYCSCQDDFYLSDDSKCKQAHQCNSIICPSIGQLCDESRPFNKTQPCQCNEKLDWYPDPQDPNKCHRRQCHDKQRDCGFDAHLCLPTLAGEKPICKCGPKFVLKQNEKTGQKYCQSVACVLPTLNDCKHICLENNTNLERPYDCACHEGYTLDKDGKSCRIANTSSKLAIGKQLNTCRPTCDPETQICTDHGCKCKQGFIAEGEVVVRVAKTTKQVASGTGHSNSSASPIDYVQRVKCLNVCSLTYGENKEEFEKVQSVCPLGLCDPATFECRCSDPKSAALINTKYEPIYESTASGDEGERVRVSPLCHLKRVCRQDSENFNYCRSRGAICVPDYTKAAMFDCICPPWSEKHNVYSAVSASDFTCRPRCSAIEQTCAIKWATCKPVERDEVKCDCLPGFMPDKHEPSCHLAKFSYALNLIVVNKYYEPETRFHKLAPVLVATPNETVIQNHEAQDSSSPDNSDSKPTLLDIQDILPRYQKSLPVFESAHSSSSSNHSHKQTTIFKSIFIAEYNQCNISQIVPKSILEDPYEHDLDSYLSYIDQCNEKLHKNVRNFHLNSRLAEDLRKSLRQHLRDFTVTTNESLCHEFIDSGFDYNNRREHSPTGLYLNCTVYLQSMEPIEPEAVERVLTNCDKHTADDRFCWIKPRLLLRKFDNLIRLADPQHSHANQQISFVNLTNFHQIYACEIDKFCGDDAVSLHHDDKTSLCSCKCPADLRWFDVKSLESIQSRTSSQHGDQLAGRNGNKAPVNGQQATHPYLDGEHQDAAWNQLHLLGAVKEICYPRNHCDLNGTEFCSGKPGSSCHYDDRFGSKCKCIYPSYENAEGHCVEVAFNPIIRTLIVIVILLGCCLLVSLAVNLYALAKSRSSLFGHSKQYPLNEFPSSRAEQQHSRTPASNNNNNHNYHSSSVTSRRMNRSTGMPNLAFDDND